MVKNNTRKIIYAGIFTALTAAGAFIKIPLPPVPLTLQTFFTILAGAVLPPRYAFTSQIAYLLLGLAGLPVFALGGGMGYILQPSFGYLLSLPFVACLIALGVRQFNSKKTLVPFIWINFLGAGVVLFLGTMWMYVAVNYFSGKSFSIQSALLAGFILFVPGELVKAVIAAYLAVQYYKKVERSKIM